MTDSSPENTMLQEDTDTVSTEGTPPSSVSHNKRNSH